MGHTIGQIADALGAVAEGDLDIVVRRAAEPAMAGASDLALAMSPAYAAGLAQGTAVAALVWPGADWRAMGLKAVIFAPRGRLAMAGLSRLMDAGPHIVPGVHAMAVVDASARIGDGAAIGPFVVIGADVVIGTGVRIASHVSIAQSAHIGDDALLLQGVRIGPGVVIGDRFIAQPGAVIGADGFSYVTPEESGVEEIRKTLGARAEDKP